MQKEDARLPPAAIVGAAACQGTLLEPVFKNKNEAVGLTYFLGFSAQPNRATSCSRKMPPTLLITPQKILSMSCRKYATEIIASIVFLMPIISLVVSCESNSQNTSKTLAEIPTADRQVLEDFFYDLIVNSYFGQTLMGEKPVSFESSFISTPGSFDALTSDKTSLFIRKAEKVWNKHKESFCLRDFVIKFHDNKKVLTVFLINKSSFLEAVRSNISIFRDALGADTSPESLLETIASKDTDWDAVIKNNVIVEGILLGFGTRNSITYDRFHKVYTAIEQPLPPPWREELCQDSTSPDFSHNGESISCFVRSWGDISDAETSHLMVPQKGFRTLREEYYWFREKYRNGARLRPVLYHVSRFEMPAFFIDDQDDEVRHLLSRYQESRKKLAKLYSDGDFLEITLKKLTGEL